MSKPSWKVKIQESRCYIKKFNIEQVKNQTMGVRALKASSMHPSFLPPRNKRKVLGKNNLQQQGPVVLMHTHAECQGHSAGRKQAAQGVNGCAKHSANKLPKNTYFTKFAGQGFATVVSIPLEMSVAQVRVPGVQILAPLPIPARTGSLPP